MRTLLLLATVLAVLVAGCAEGPAGTPGATMNTPSAAEAVALLAHAAGNVPDRYGVAMAMTRDGQEAMSAEAAFDEPAKTAFFRIRMDPALMGEAGAGFAMMGGVRDVTMYASPQGTVLQLGPRVMVMPPDEGDAPWSSSAEENEGLAALTDPQQLLASLGESDVTVESVTATTLRGKPALKLEVTVAEEGEARSMTLYLLSLIHI